MMLTGDLLFRIMNGTSMTTDKLCRFSVNVAFLKDQFIVEKDELDPNDLKKDTRFPAYFKIGLITEKG